jgi:formylglycine-generating enzyme
MGGTMQKVVPLVFISALAIAAASCSLFVSLDGLSDNASAGDSGDDSCVLCNDAAGGDGAPQEAGNDSSADAGINPCLDGGGTAGPRMIQADGYCIDSTEVTVAQYMQFVGDAGAAGDFGQVPVCAWNVEFAPVTDGTDDPRCTPANVDPTFRPNFPITCVDWCDAFAYCEWAGKRLCGAITGGPASFDSFSTNSQWFLACATTANTTYPNDSNDGGRCILNASESVQVGTTNCNGGYPGLTDMVGNVEEWVDSCNNQGELSDDAGGTAFDYCHDEGDEFQENFHGTGCGDNDIDNRNEFWAGIGFRCCSK